jgi:hypothetical protein
MNPRIIELMKQAGIVPVYRHKDAEGCWYETPNYEAEKFAELIVKECMGVARGMRNPPNLNYKPSDRFVDELRLHFGVKE